MGRPLEHILEEQFSLAYHKLIEISEYDEMEIKETQWFVNRLIKQKRAESEEANRAIKR